MLFSNCASNFVGHNIKSSNKWDNSPFDDLRKFRVRGGSSEPFSFDSRDNNLPVDAHVAMMNAHAMSIDECLNCLEVKESQGLSSNAAQARLEVYGLNSLTAPPPKSLLQLLCEQFDDRLVQILLGVAYIYKQGRNVYFHSKLTITFYLV